jgi:hypothetical protein
MAIRFLVALLAVAGVAEAATFRGAITGGERARVTITARKAIGGRFVGTFTCRGPGCPIKRGRIRWSCTFSTGIGGIENRRTFAAITGRCDARDGFTSGNFHPGTGPGRGIYFARQ